MIFMLVGKGQAGVFERFSMITLAISIE